MMSRFTRSIPLLPLHPSPPSYFSKWTCQLTTPLPNREIRVRGEANATKAKGGQAKRDPVKRERNEREGEHEPGSRVVQGISVFKGTPRE